MNEIYVSNRSELLSALSSATGGETIVLRNGDYGSLDIVNERFSQYVTIEAQNNGGAKFDSIGIRSSERIKIDGVHVDNPGNGAAASTLVAVSDNSKHIRFMNSEVNGKVDGTYTGHFGLYTKDVEDVVFENNYVHDVKRGGVFYSAEGLEVVGNQIEYIGDDDFKFIGVKDVLIENNIGARYVFPEPGAHLDFVQFQGTDSSDIVIRGNLKLPENWDSIQGIFFDDANYTNILIEQNIIVTGMIRGISISSGSNIVARYNTVLDIDGAASKATHVMLPGGNQSYGNVEGSYRGSQGNNLVLQQGDSGDAFYYGDYFANATAGRGITLEDLRPTANYDQSFGAYARLMELLDGTVVEPPAPEPPAPEPPAPEPPAPEPPAPEPPQPQPGPGATLYSFPGSREISNAGDVIEVGHGRVFEVAAATIGVTFNADTVSGRYGLVSKDAAGLVGGGHHFTSYIEDGTLHVRFQNGADDQVITVGGLRANRDYDFEARFGDGQVSVWLDGALVGSANFETSWETNVEVLQIGANGWASASGAAGFVDVFDGTISNVFIVSGTPTEVVVQYGDAAANLMRGLGGDDAIVGRAGNDTLAGGAGNDTLEGNLDRDKLSGGRGADSLMGGDDADTLDGGIGRDQLFGGRGNDVLIGEADGDTLDGGEGADFLQGGGGADFLRGGDGMDMLRGGNFDDTLWGGDGLDELRGGNGSDTLDGGGSADMLIGHAGLDSIVGAAGDDTLMGGKGADILLGGDHNDLLIAGDGFDTLRGGDGVDTLNGGKGDDRLVGELGADRLRGGDNNDVLLGGTGNDTLNGGKGNDILTGGTGGDRFRFTEDGGSDIITDFMNGEDTLDFTDFDLANFNAVRSLASSTSSPNETRFEFADGETLLVRGLNLNNLDSSDVLI
ncbi:MAG: right-handed parallel beta-helix repeat-containing protein [Pseudomonadota bacterium]